MMKHKRKALFLSLISLMLCFSMLVGTTFAWFTDSVKTGINTIAAGVLDVKLYHSNAAVQDEKVNSSTELFMDLSGKDILWEPGVVSYENLRVANEGDLALAYQMSIATDKENFVLDPSGTMYGLSQILKVGVVKGGITATDRAGVIASVAETEWTTLADFLRNGSLLADAEDTWGIVIYWEPGEFDNYWNLNNGKILSSGDTLQIDLGIKLIATQEVHESDSFGNDYDADAKAFVFPKFAGGTASATVVVDANGLTAADVIMASGAVSATVPTGAKLAAGVSELTLTVSSMDGSSANVTLSENEDMRSLDVHIEGLAADNTVPATIVLAEAAPAGLNMGNYKLYHVENGNTVEMTYVAPDADFTAHNQFKYDPVTGDVVLYMATFSEVTVVADTDNAWEGNFDYSWYVGRSADYTIANADQLAAFGAIVGGMNGQTQYAFADKTVKLIADINLGDAEDKNNENIIFYPIGYYNSTGSYEKTSGGSVTSSVSSFEGTFDGNGHTIANFYQNTWEMFGDYNNGYSGTPNHYKDAMGLFGYVHGGTVKNLTVSNFSSDGEFTPTGVIAAYAGGNAKFENIAIVGCNPRVYNTGNGGIIGIAGDTSAANDDHITLKNITVDNSNKISALWGSYDVACGGLVGMYRGNVDGSGNATGDTINFENCHVSAQMDVYNDVCGNYQYYAYRYAGMIIGSVRHNKTEGDKTVPNMTGISASGCTVNYGDWNDYYYCEFVKNGHPSYAGETDYKFSRVPENELTRDSNGKVTGCTHAHSDVEDNRAIYLPFYQLFTGYGWGVNSVGLKEYSGIETNLDITEGEQQASVEKFAVALNADTLLEANKEISVGSLFSAIDGAKINGSAVQVSVSAMDDSGIVGTYTANTSDWTQGTLIFNKVEGMCTVTIQDYNFCKPTSFVLKDGKLYSYPKFEKLFTKDFLYRVGNANPVALSSLFAEVNGKPVGEIEVTIEPVNGNASGQYKDNDTWNKGTIQFSGTGVVKVTIEDEAVGSIPTELMLEVVDAYNATTALSAPYKYNGVNYNVVLLNDVTNGSFTVSGDYGFYGNGFTITLNPNSHSTKRGAGFVGYIHMTGGTLDNVRIEGPTFAAANIYREQGQTGTGADDPVNYFRNGVIIDSGDVKITNSYLSGARTALYIKGAGDVLLENTTVSGGAYANIEVSVAETVTLRNVKTVQKETVDSYGQGKSMIGLAIVIDSANTKLILDGVTQDNWMTYDQWSGMLGTYESQFPKLFTDSAYTDLWHKNTTETKIVNTGIIYACDVTTLNMEGNIPGYDKTAIKVASTNGYVYTLENGGNSNKVIDGTSTPDYGSDDQTAIPPVTTFDYTSKNYQQYVDGNDVYCYYDAGVVKIGFTKGDSKVWNPMILSIKKDDKTITDYKVKFNGEDYTNKSITFTESGTYEVEYTYTDPYNYKYSDGKLVSYSVNYKEKVTITVNVTEEQAKNAEFTMKNQPVNKVQVGENVYLSATGVNASDLTQSNSFSNSPVSGAIKHNYNKDNKTGWGCLTISGQTIYFPIVPMLTTDDTFEHTGSWYGCFPVFEGVIEIKDYADEGTAESPTVYDGNTTEMPTTLKALDPQSYFVYQGTASKVPTTPSKVTKGYYKGKLCYTTQTDLTASNERGEVWTLATYTYTDNKGATYYWYVGYYCAASRNGGCVTGDTLITLANGEQKRIDQLTYQDELLAWDFYSGCYATTTASVIYNHGDSIHTVTNLNFSDGTTVKIINEHEFFDVEANSFVYISQKNAIDYIGHEFIKADEGGYRTVTLQSCVHTKEETGMYTILTAKYNNAIVEGMLALTPDPTNKCEDFFRLYAVGEGMKFDEAKMQADIEQYGLFTYEDLAEYVTYEEFVAFNGEFYKILVGKGLITVEDIVMALATYAPNH